MSLTRYFWLRSWIAYGRRRGVPARVVRELCAWQEQDIRGMIDMTAMEV
jgi:hypothetical protein